MSPASVLRSLRAIRHAAIAIVIFVICGEIIIAFGDGYECPPALFMGLLVSTIAALMFALAKKYEQAVRALPDRRSE